MCDMEFKKNDLVQLKIEDMSTDGEGIGKTDGFTVFVKDAVIGDEILAKIIKTKKTYGYGRLMEIITPSPKRATPRCSVSRSCGGCQLQALSYEEQLKYKENKVRGNLERIGGFKEIPMEPVIGMEDPWHYRNKAQFPVGKDRDGRIIAGFYAGRTHSIIESRDCPLGHPVNQQIVDIVISHMTKYGIEPYDETTGKGLVRHILIRRGFHTGQIMVCIVVNGKRIPRSDVLTEQLTGISGMTSICLNVNRENTNVILGDKIICLWGKPSIEDRIGELSFRISPLSFYQVNTSQTEKLYDKALEYASLTGNETVWDLYCGIGTISLYLAQKARAVKGVEIIPAAIENARENAELNHIENAEFFAGKAEEVLPEYYERTGERADVIVVDPPRKGCDKKLLGTIIRMNPEKVVYVSCDSATLARDLKILCENGYELKKVCPVDQFCQTVHCEVVCSLTQKA